MLENGVVELLAVSDTEPGVDDLWAYFTADLRCNGCPPDKLMFDNQRVTKERILQYDSEKKTMLSSSISYLNR